MEIQPVALPLPDLLCSTPLLQVPGLAGWLSYLTPSSIINIINLQLSFLCSVDESCSAAKKIEGTFFIVTQDLHQHWARPNVVVTGYILDQGKLYKSFSSIKCWSAFLHHPQSFFYCVAKSSWFKLELFLSSTYLAPVCPLLHLCLSQKAFSVKCNLKLLSGCGMF